MTDKENPDSPGRKLNDLGLYSHAAETALKLPQARGSVDQLLAALKNKGVKKDEIDFSDIERQMRGKSQVTPQEIAQYFSDRLPKIDVRETADATYRKYTLKDPNDRNKLAGRKYREHLLKLTNIPHYQHQNFTRSHFYDPNVLMHFRTQDFLQPKQPPQYAWRHPNMDRTVTANTKLGPKEVQAAESGIPGLVVHQAIGAEPHLYSLTHVNSGLTLIHDVPYHAIQKAVEEIKDYGHDWTVDRAELARTVDPEVKALARKITANWKSYARAPVARRPRAAQADANKVLYIDEIQSDWGQKGRDEGFFGKPKTIAPWALDLAKKYKELEIQRISAPDFVAGGGISQEQHELAKALKRAGVGMTRFDSRIRNDFRNNTDTELNQQSLQAFGKDGPVPLGPYVDNTEKWADLGLKYLLGKAVKEGKTHIVSSPSAEQIKRYGSSTGTVVGSALVNYSPELNLYKIVTSYYPRGDQKHFVLPGIEEDYVHPEELRSNLPKKMFDAVTSNNPQNVTSDPEHIKQLERVSLSLSNLPNSQSYRYEFPDSQVVKSKTGQEFMYDQLLPRRLEALAKQHDPDAKVEPYDGPHEAIKGFPSLRITPRMAQSIKTKGFKAFKRGGAVVNIDHALSVAKQVKGGK